ncbi:DMT family transporter [Planktotalea sp.]|uniref:DMT family transporter n=1 Tax=Planktotalea sp. TaxID=2029877 RepID=UPI003299860D
MKRLDLTSSIRSASAMDRKTSLDGIGLFAIVSFAVLIAFNQVVVKTTLVGIQPVFSAALRSLIGLMALGVWMWFRGISPRMSRAQIKGGILVGVLFGIEFLCLFVALDLTTISRASVIFYTMPVWLGLAAHFVLPGEQLSGLRLIGFILAVCGVAWAFLDRSSGQASLLGDVLALIGALCWAGITLAVRLTAISTARAEVQLMCQLAISALIFFALAPFFGPLIREFTWVHGAGILFQSLVTVFFGFLLFFALMKIYPASDLAAFAFLSPVLSVLMGWAILGEHIGPEIIGALVLVCLGLVLISRRPKV